MATLGTFEPKGLIAGDFPTVVQEIILTGPVTFLCGDVVAEVDGVHSLVDSAGAGNAALAVGIICDDIVVDDGITTKANMYIKGEFNHRFLRFGGSDTSDDHRRRMREIGLIIRETRI